VIIQDNPPNSFNY